MKKTFGTPLFTKAMGMLLGEKSTFGVVSFMCSSIWCAKRSAMEKFRVGSTKGLYTELEMAARRPSALLRSTRPRCRFPRTSTVRPADFKATSRW